MTSMDPQPSVLKLSVCITTLNRAEFIGATLESILRQVTGDCEVVVLDGASTDDTEEVVTKHAQGFDCLRYIRADRNCGLDQDYDRAVEMARGEYCWLMTDDDLLKPGALATVLMALREDVSLVITNVESRNFNMSTSDVLHRRWLDFQSDRIYGPREIDQLVIDVGQVLKYIGCLVIKRSIWMERDRERHFGSLFNYLSVIFQGPLPGRTIVIAEPLVSYRWGNAHEWAPKLFETLVVKLPSVVSSLAISDTAKRKLCSAKPWRSIGEMLYLRARGCYSLAEYRQWIRPQLRSPGEAFMPRVVALMPGLLVNLMLMMYFSLSRRRHRGVWEPEVVLQALRQSRFYLGNWRGFWRAT